MTAFDEKTRIAVIGGGKMGEAILGGWIASGEGCAAALGPANFVVAEPGEARRALLASAYGVECVADACEILRADIVLIAVKPQVVKDVLAGMREGRAYAGGPDGPLFVSIAAGVTTDRLESELAPASRVVRTMPNMPLQIGAGATAVVGGSGARDADVRLVRDLFACLGVAYIVEEADMDAVCAVSGSGPAYVCALIEALAASGSRAGLDPEVAEKLALQTVYGTAKLIIDADRDVSELRESVCSPGGTTLAALAAMQEHGFDDSLDAGVRAAVRRSKELADS